MNFPGAGHELKGLMSVVRCPDPIPQVPLMCIVDYRGFRLIAVSLLPISEDTLLYGTCNGGETVKNSPEVEPMVKRMAEHIGLKVLTQKIFDNSGFIN